MASIADILKENVDACGFEIRRIALRTEAFIQLADELNIDLWKTNTGRVLRKTTFEFHNLWIAEVSRNGKNRIYGFKTKQFQEITIPSNNGR
jgi:hypothetical protein